MGKLKWIKIDEDMHFGFLQKTKVPGGWLVRGGGMGATIAVGLTFIPDPNYKWK